jgi:hypothetical protein
MSGLELLDGVSFKYYFILYLWMVVVVLAGALVLRWGLHKKTSSDYLLLAAIGSFVGLIVLAAPHFYPFAESEVFRMVTGSNGRVELLISWPDWPGFPMGPFTSLVFGTLSGCVGGCGVLWLLRSKRRNRPA